MEAELSSPKNFKTSAYDPEKINFETHAQDEVDFYIKKLSEQMSKGSLSGIKVVLDCANGATYLTSPTVLSYFGAELILIGNEPDGSNINQEQMASRCNDALPVALAYVQNSKFVINSALNNWV